MNNLKTWLTTLLLVLLAPIALAQDGAQEAAAPASAAWAGKDNRAGKPVIENEKLQHGIGNPSCTMKGASGASSANCDVTLSLDEKATQQTFFFGGLSLNLPISDSSTNAVLGSLDGLAQTYTAGASLSFAAPMSPVVPGKPLPQWVIGSVSFKGGPQSSKWYDTTTLAKQTKTHFAQDFTALLGTTFGENGSSGAYVRGHFQRTYPDAASKTLCPAETAGSVAPVTCVSGPIGAPSEKISRIIGLEADIGRWADYPFKILLNRDFKNHISGAEIPVYLKKWTLDKAGDVWLGLDASWTNDPASSRKGTLAVVLTNAPFRPYHAD